MFPAGRALATRSIGILRALRSVHVQPLPGGVAEVFATVRRGTRYGALALRLELVDGGWRCTALEGA